MSKSDKIDKNRVPKHIAIIMDGNGRWAKSKGLERYEGHQEGVASVKAVVEAAAKIDVKFLTLYAFSTENWNRPKEEVNALMSILIKTIREEILELSENGVRLKVIGNIDDLPEEARKEVNDAIKDTAHNKGLTLVIALSYSSRWEIKNAVAKIIEDCSEQNINPKDVTVEFVSSYMTTKDIPDPELLIRTSGEYRISNFLLWQIAYSELYFTDIYWPDFREEEFYEAIINYQKRERRFGKTSEQL